MRTWAGAHGWGVYVDPALVGLKTTADFREAQAAISRLRHAYQRCRPHLDKTPIPVRLRVIPGAFIPARSQTCDVSCYSVRSD